MKAKWYAAALLLIILLAGCMLFQNVDAVQNFFSPSIRVTMRNSNVCDEWQRLEVGETGYLNYDSMFYQKALVLDGNCDKEASFRIRDQQGNVIMRLTLSPGTKCELDTLKKHTNYMVEVKTAGEYICATFI